MTICTSITETYLNKCSRFFESVRENFTGKRICFTIGFMAVIEGWETVYVEKCEYDWKPTNRKNYASLQHGEFIKHYDFAPDEMICFMDADMILQRKWDITFPPTKGVLVTQCSWPRQRLGQVARNLRCKRMDKFFSKYQVLYEVEFCTCFIVATSTTWRGIYAECKSMYDMLLFFKHHAAWQLLINIAVLRTFKVMYLPDYICCAEWYTGSPMKEGKVGEELVYFNHTK